MQKRTKIVCTLGPSCEDKETIKEMVKAGMNVARLNFSHGNYENHKMLMTNIREVAEELDHPVAILQDLQGPKIRLGVLPEEGVELKQGEEIVFDTALQEYKGKDLPVDYKDLHKFVVEGERILLSDGKQEVKVKKVEGTKITTSVVVGGIVFSHKGINVPDSKLEISALTEKDKKDARFGIENKVDLIALSFVMKAQDVLDLKYLLKSYEKELGISEGEPETKIIAKIERSDAVKNIDEIMQVVDGIMVARGDLGIESQAEDVPLIQKKLIDKAIEAGKPVIVATQMLDSMQNNPRPTRAEVSDVANAVIDHTDAVMLSNETATGKYPVETVATMAKIITETEKSAYDNLLLKDRKVGVGMEKDDIISRLARVVAEDSGAKLILAASISGETGRLISRYRPELNIAVATNTEKVRHQLNLSWGVSPFILPECRSIEELVERSITYLKKKKSVKTGDSIVVVAGEPVGQSGHINLLEIKDVN